jgi:hypothetical protein
MSETWIWGYNDAFGAHRWYYHEGPGSSYMTTERTAARRYTTKFEAQRRLRQHRRAWGSAGRRYVLIRLKRTVPQSSEEKT